MKLSIKHFFVLPALIILMFSSCSEKNIKTAEIDIIPKPVSLQKGEGVFEIDEDTKILITGPSLRKGAEIFSGIVSASSTFKPEIKLTEDGSAKSGNIIISLSGLSEKYGNEGYSLDVTPDNITIEAAAPAGAFYGLQTLRQLFPPELEKKGGKTEEWYVPAVKIFDKPEFKWRGQLLDVSRHFFPVEVLKMEIDHLSRYKMNVFHLHLTDDQGWRIEVKSYPKLTEIGAWRVDYNDLPWWKRPPQKPGEKATYGGYYTQDQIREIVQYAADRFINILPEIDVPGHSQAIIASYPELSCDEGKYFVATGGVFKDNTICPAKDVTYEFLRKVFEEIFPLFPFQYFHIGGDECNKLQWEKSPACQQLIRKEGLKDEKGLQSYFITKVEKIINGLGKKMIGWDEILQGGLAPNATVMSWRGEKGGIKSVKMEHDVVMTPNNFCYLDLKQGDPALEPPYGYSKLWISKAYSYELIPKSFNREESDRILGVQGNLWSESLQNERDINYMLFPRLLAIAEVGWTPKKNRHWDDFVKRLEYNLIRLKNLGIVYAPSMYNVNVTKDKSGKIILSTERGGLPIHYTINGPEPSVRSELYSEPIFISDTTKALKAAAFHDGKRIGRITTYVNGKIKDLYSDKDK